MIHIIPSKYPPKLQILTSAATEQRKTRALPSPAPAPPPGLMAPPIKYKRRRVSAIRRFSKGCDPAAAVGKPNAVPQPDPIVPSKPESPLAAGTTAAHPPSAPTSDTASSLQSTSNLVVKEQSLRFLNPQPCNLRVLPKRRKISANRKFPVGCGRVAVPLLRKAQQSKGPVAVSEIKRLVEEPQPVAPEIKSLGVENTAVDDNAVEKIQEKAHESVLVEEKMGLESVLLEGNGGELIGSVRGSELTEESKLSPYPPPSRSKGRTQSGGKGTSSVKKQKRSKEGSVALEILGDRLIV